MLAPLSRLLLDLHPALLLLLLLDFLLLILLLTPFVVSGFGLRGRSRPHAADSTADGGRRRQQRRPVTARAAPRGRGGRSRATA